MTAALFPNWVEMIMTTLKMKYSHYLPLTFFHYQLDKKTLTFL
ncbi:hypothetical protein ykris0001_18160 [Yersinia kristensenii ATCC 33638]|nr:hypothetical protein ykris0001_18160 [Yersinia kristensenii ATCC 33638]